MAENPVELELTEQDKLDLEMLGTDIPGVEDVEFHPILHVWRAVLEPAAGEAKKKVTPQWASRTCAQYAELTFKDMQRFSDRYYSKIEALRQILEAEIASDEECLNPATPEEDVAENAMHYKNLLAEWQKAFLQWELDWECTSDDAAIELAAISEVHKMFFSQTGIVAFLDNIKLEYTEADQAALSAELEAMKEAQ